MKSNVKTVFFPGSLIVILLLASILGTSSVFASGSSGGDAYLGVYTQLSNKMLQDRTDTGVRGLYVQKVERRSPADEAGIEAGDIILSVGKRDITNRKALQRALWKMEPGDIVKITVWRDGKKVEFEATLGSKAEQYEFASSKGVKEYKRARNEYFRKIRLPRTSTIVHAPDVHDGTCVLSHIKRPDFPDALDRARATKKAKQALYELSVKPIEVPDLSIDDRVMDLRGLEDVIPLSSEGFNDRMAVD